MTWSKDDPYLAESKKIVWEVAPWLRGRGLDIGAGDFKILPHAVSVDNFDHVRFGFKARPDVLTDATDLGVFADQSMDFVYSSHTLEHIEDYEGALKEWWRVLKVGGFLVLYLPDEDEYPKIGSPHANPDHKWDVNYDKLVAAMGGLLGWDLVDFQKRNQTNEYSLLFVFKKVNSKFHGYSYKNPKPKKTACVVRYGAYGDLMQTSSVLAGLKKQGYHVTLFSSLPGAAAVTEDPNIDSLVLFDKDQVPNADLGPFWDYQKNKFDKWVNLSESVEGTLLAMNGRIIHGYPPALRHKLMNHNYTQLQHEVAEVPYELAVKFYAKEEEQAWAKAERAKLGGGPVVMWSLAGSSVHKTWAGLDNIMASLLLEYPESRIVLVGGPECVILEAGWENEKRVLCTSGKWSIRQTLSFIAECDLIIGPETGVLNAAACEPMAKVVFLSHSTHENLTRDWVNTIPLRSKETNCPGRGNNAAPACHMLHFGWSSCRRDDETGTAQCQKDITVDAAWAAVVMSLDNAFSPVKELA